MRSITFSEGIKLATQKLLEIDPSVVVIGLGASYKNGLDGTIGNLSDIFPDRVLDTPLSEAGNGGACVGMAINGLKPIFHHGRTEFALFAIDSIAIQSSKWHYMFGGNGGSVPIVFRIAVGRAWGSGAQHSQALYPLWANCAGLKAVVPSTPKMARDLLYTATLDPNPVAYIEPRWLYNISETVDEEPTLVPLNKARIVRHGSDITIVTYADGVHESLLAANYLLKRGVSVAVVDLVSINPIDYDSVREFVRITGLSIFVEPSNGPCSICGDVASKIQSRNKAIILSSPHTPIPAATSLTSSYYLNWRDIVKSIVPSIIIGEDATFEELHLAPKTNISAAL